MSEAVAGRWPASITDYGFSKTKAGKEQLYIKLNVAMKNEQGESFAKAMTWYCQLTEKGTDIALNALVACGVKSPDMALIAKGAAGGALNLKSELNAVVEQSEEYGMQVRYLNGTDDVLGKMDHAEAAQSDVISSASILLGKKLQAKSQARAKAGDIDL